MEHSVRGLGHVPASSRRVALHGSMRADFYIHASTLRAQLPPGRLPSCVHQTLVHPSISVPVQPTCHELGTLASQEEDAFYRQPLAYREMGRAVLPVSGCGTGSSGAVDSFARSVSSATVAWRAIAYRSSTIAAQVAGAAL